MNLLLLLAVSCFWFGCNTAAKELVKERVIFLRERAFNLRVAAYFASKFLVLALIGVLQATLLFLIVRTWCRPPGSPVFQWAALAALAVAGTAIGLLISALARSEEVATALVPIAVIPQIILAGVVAPLEGPARLLAEWFITVYRGQQALESLLPEADLTFLGRSARASRAPARSCSPRPPRRRRDRRHSLADPSEGRIAVNPERALVLDGGIEIPCANVTLVA